MEPEPPEWWRYPDPEETAAAILAPDTVTPADSWPDDPTPRDD